MNGKNHAGMEMVNFWCVFVRFKTKGVVNKND